MANQGKKSEKKQEVNMLNAALVLASAGYKIFPQKGKIPLINDWINQASSDYEQIKEWWLKWPDANIGCVTGKRNNLIVLDIDVKNGQKGEESFRRLKQDFRLTPTLQHTTPSGGLHVFFCYPKGMEYVRNLKELPGYPGIELKADGGAVTMPPSPGYSVASHIRKAMESPSWIKTLIKKSEKQRGSGNKSRKETKKENSLRNIPAGERNVELTSLAGKMRNMGLGYEEILFNLDKINKERCIPPLPGEELKRIAESISRYEVNEKEKVDFKIESSKVLDMHPVQCPDADLKVRILKEIHKGDGAPIEIRRMHAGYLLVEWMKKNGFFLQNTSREFFYFSNNKKRLYSMEKEEFKILLHEITGCNASGKNMNYFYNDCRTVAANSEMRSVYKVAYFDKKKFVLHVSKFNGMVLRLDGDIVEEIPNGLEVLFDDIPGWKPYEPDYTKNDVFEHLIYNIPNWAGDKKVLGTAFKAWVIATFFTDICPTRPILSMLGEKGSGKSMTLRLFLRYLFGDISDVSGVPDKPDGFIAEAAAKHIMILDNMDNTVYWMRDKLARLATGATDHYRKLYTSNECAEISYRCWAACTSRTPDTLKRDDLADRLVILPVERINEEIQQAEIHFLEEVGKTRNLWWGSVIKILSSVVAAIKMGYLQDKVKLRMGDWERLGRVISIVENRETEWNTFVNKLPETQSEFLLDGEPICDALDSWSEDENNYHRKVTARELFNEFSDLLSHENKSNGFYKTIQSFSRKLSQIKTDLAARYGMKWEKGTTKKTHNKMVYWFERMS